MSDESESGGCLCGAVKFGFEKPNLISAHHCHCIDCQKSTGSGKATILMLPSKAIKMEGELKFHTTTTASGRNMNRGFCRECGSPVLSFIEEMPEVKFVKAGSLDDSSGSCLAVSLAISAWLIWLIWVILILMAMVFYGF